MIIPFFIKESSKLDPEEFWYQDDKGRWKIGREELTQTDPLNDKDFMVVAFQYIIFSFIVSGLALYTMITRKLYSFYGMFIILLVSLSVIALGSCFIFGFFKNNE